MFENLSDKLEKAFKGLKGQGRITDINIASSIKEIRRALVDADVNYAIAKEFTDSVKEKALGQQILTSVAPSQLMVKIVQDELTELMGGTHAEFKTEKNPSVILVAGLQGSGKTTFSAKLALFLKSKKGKQPLLVAGDVYRPAAIEQLQVLAGQIEVPVYTEEGEKDPVKITKNAISEAKKSGKDVVIIDTAGRLAVDEEMMKEIEAIHQASSPEETLLTSDWILMGLY